MFLTMQKIMTLALPLLLIFLLTPTNTTAQKSENTPTVNHLKKRKNFEFQYAYKAEVFGFFQPEAKEFSHSNKITSLGYKFVFESKLKGTPFVFTTYEEVSLKRIVEKEWESPGPIKKSIENVIEASTGIGINFPFEFGKRHGICVQIAKDIITVENSKSRFNQNWPRVSTFFYFDLLEDFIEIGIGNVYQFKLTHTVTPTLKIEFNL